MSVTPDFTSAHRKVLVTPSFFPENRNFDEFEGVVEPVEQAAKNLFKPLGLVLGTVVPGNHAQHVGHVDYLAMRQSHEGANLPRINDGAVIRINAEGEHENTTLRAFQIAGSFESSCFLRCDGETVDFIGNPSRWGRPDNVFGYSFSECLVIVNRILVEHDLPPFTAGVRSYRLNKGGGQGEVRHFWTGATISRIDITENYATGSPEQAHSFMRWLSTQKLGSKKTKSYADYETVDFGAGSKRNYFKVYNKGIELLKHNKAKPETDSFQKQGRLESIDKIAQWVSEQGLVRAELTVKSKALHDLNCYYLGDLDMTVIEAEFKRHTSVFERADAEHDFLSELPRATLATYRMWQAGDNLKIKLGKSQYYAHRNKLLPFGIDIAIPSSVVRFEPKTRVITLSAVTPPDWYSLPSVRELRAA